MITDLEIWRAANQLLQRYGEHAEFEAAARADQMIEQGDPEGLALWKRVLTEIDELQSTEPTGSVH